MSTETKEQGINPIPAEKEGGGDEWTWANRFCYNDLMRAMMAMAGWCSQIRMRDAIHGTEAGNYSDEFIKNTWPERLSPTTEPVPTEYAAQEVAKEREKANKLIEALEGLYIGHQFTASFESKEAQSKYNEALRNAKEAIKTYKHG